MFAETTNRPEVFTSTARYFCPILIKFGIYQQISIEVPIIKSHAILPLEAALIQADRRIARRADRWTKGRKGKRTA